MRSAHNMEKDFACEKCQNYIEHNEDNEFLPFKIGSQKLLNICKAEKGFYLHHNKKNQIRCAYC